jgi:HK97 family phage portal protein
VIGGMLKVPASFTPEVKAAITADWKNKHGGRNSHSMAVVPKDVEFQQFETNAQTAQLVESRRMSVEDVARFFGVPLVLLQVQQSAQGYGSNLRELMLDFTRRCLAPWANRLTEELAFKLFPQRSPWREFELDFAWLTRGTELDRATAAEKWINTGVMSVNEVRAAEGLNGIGPEGDQHKGTKPEPVPEPEETDEEIEQEEPVKEENGEHVQP